MENADILKAFGELRTAIEDKQKDFLTIDKTEKIVEDIVKKLHPDAGQRIVPAAGLPATPEAVMAKASWFKNSIFNKASAPWTSDYGKQFGNMKTFIVQGRNSKAYTGNNLTTAADGGDVVPTEFLNKVIMLLNETSMIFQEAFILPMNSGKRDIPAGATNPTTGWITEAGVRTHNKPTFGKVAQVAKTVFSLVELTDELLEDSEIDLESYIAFLVAQAISLEVENIGFAGDVDQGDPFDGVLNASGIVSVPMNGAEFAYDDVVDLTHGGSQAYAEGAKVFTSRTGLKKLMKLKDENGHPLWQPPAGAVPATVNGEQYVISSKIPTDLGSGNDETAAIFGNLKKYLIISPRNSMELLASKHAYDPTSQVSAFFSGLTFARFTQRYSINVAYGGAFRVLQFK